MTKLRAKHFFLVTGETRCWKCSEKTSVSSIVLGGYDEDDEENGWVPSTDRALLGYVTEVDADSLDHINQKAPWLRHGPSQTAERDYLGNCCTSCDVLLGDWFLRKPEAIFFPTNPSEMQDFAVWRADQDIAVDAEPAWSAWLDWIPLSSGAERKQKA
jgi:hypothetical protein